MLKKNLFGLMLSLALSVTFSISAQTTTYRPGIIRLKFKESHAKSISAEKLKTKQFGLNEVDIVSKRLGVKGIKRVFREAGTFESAHKQYGLHLWYEIEFDTAVSVNYAITQYKKLSNFEKVEACKPYYSIEPISKPNSANAKSIISSPVNDPLFSQQWHYQNTGQTGGTVGADISLPQAWTIQAGNNSVIVAVIDGGIDIHHPELENAMWVNADEIAGNNIDDDQNGYVDDVNGYGFGDNMGTLYPDHHGTHVGGTIAAVTNNGIGVSGIAGGSGNGNGVRLMSCAGFGYFNVGGFEDAMVYAADNGAVISQNSWGGGSSSIEAAIDYFKARAGYDNTDANFTKNIQVGPMAGGIVIFAAGNDDSSDPSWGYPGSYPSVMAVAATDHNDTKAYFSNYGDWVDISAPGVNVYSTFPVDEGSYGTLSGTSMACPHVSGVAALIVSQFKGNSFYPSQVWDRIQYTADNIDSENIGYSGLLGAGRLNAYHALQTADEVPPDAITDLVVSEKKLNSIVLSWTSSGESGSVGLATSYDIRYSKSIITAQNFQQATALINPPKPKIAGSAESIEIKDLDFSTAYYFAIKSSDFWGNASAISNVISGTTLSPPIISIKPSSLTESLFTGGTSTQNLTITNSGLSNLYIDIQTKAASIASLSQQLAVKPVNVPVQHLKRDEVYPLKRSMSVVQNKIEEAPAGFKSLGGRLFTLDLDNDEILEVNPENGEIIKHIPSPSLAWGADGLAFDGRYLYYGNANNTLIYRIDPDSGEIVSTIALDTNLNIDGLAYSGGYLYALDYWNSTIHEIDVENQSVIRTISPGINLTGGLSFGGKRGSVFVSDHYSYTIYEIDLNTAQVLNSFATSSPVYGLGYSDELDILFATNVSNYTIEALNPDSGILLYAFPSTLSTAIASDESGQKWLSTTSSTATIPPGSSIIVPVNFNATGLDGGQYDGAIKVSSNDPKTPLLSIPVTLTVTGAPDIFANTTAIDFDESFINSDKEMTLVITNEGTDVLKVTSVVLTGAAFKVNTDPFTLSPRQSKNITVNFKPIAASNYVGSITFKSNDPDNPSMAVTLNGKGVLAPIISVTPNALNATLQSGASTTKVLKINNTGAGDLKWKVDPAGINYWLGLSVMQGVIKPGKNQQIEVAFNAEGLLGGTYYGSIEVQSNDPATSTVSVPVTLLVIGSPKIEINESQINFEDSQVGIQQDVYIAITNAGTADLTVSLMNVSNVNFGIEFTPFTLQPGEQTYVKVFFKPVALGNHTGFLTVISNDTNDSNVKVDISGSAVSSPLVEISPTPLDFTLVKGERKTINLKIKNIGDSKMEWYFDFNWTSWLSLDVMYGSLNANEETIVKVTLDTQDLNEDTYYSSLYFYYNNEASPYVFLPVTLEVSHNHAPLVTKNIKNITLIKNADPITLNLAENFSDEDEDLMKFSLNKDNDVSVKVQIIGSVLSVDPIEVGETTIIVWAEDIWSGFAQQEFKVNVDPITAVDEAPAKSTLANYPNPFNGKTAISYTLAKSARVKLSVQDITGKIIKTLIDESQTQGAKEIIYEPNIESGIYFYSLTINGEIVGLRKMVKL